MSENNEYSVQHEPKKNRWVIYLPNREEAVLEYDIVERKPVQVIDLYHTFTPNSQRGKGLAGLLVKSAFVWAEENHSLIVPSCSYVSQTWLNNNPNYKHLYITVGSNIMASDRSEVEYLHRHRKCNRSTARFAPNTCGMILGSHFVQQRVGVDDLVLLDEINEAAIIDAIKKRYEADMIYTYIGQVLIAVNPYRTIPNLYGKNIIKNYQGRYFFEEPPHVYAIAESAYHSLMSEGLNQCVIITGESGSGKTESSKLIMQYIAAITGKSKQVQRVKEQILESNPVLEAFGNAKTVQNNNSSRFGKYFEIQFDYNGEPTGGRVTNYLLEKSRVISQAHEERNFHIFYQLLAGGSSEKSAFKLGSVDQYKYLNSSGCTAIQGVNDADEFRATKHAMNVIGIPEQDQLGAFSLLAAVLHLGNLTFKEKGAREGCGVVEKEGLNIVAQLLGTSPAELEKALTTRSVSRGGARASSYITPLSLPEVGFGRDALAKSIYSRVFDWLVEAINDSILDATSEFSIGVLDIYGFEIFKFNSFEQLCINYVNEKLQQIFIELTLKSEQEEYVKEKIQWTNIDYFNNKPCVELIEMKAGVMGILDEESIFPQGTDSSLLAKLHKNCATHKFFEKNEKDRNTFAIKHYAGVVAYNVDGFLDKNKDTLFNNLRTMLEGSKSPFISKLWVAEKVDDKKRPPTSVMQFRSQVLSLVDTLMSCHPQYIRCIRPNGVKQSKNFDMTLSTNQVKYLGLLENVRVRRAGFAYRQTYERFLHRFKMVSNETWPKWNGAAKEGTVAILKACGIDNKSYELGASKVFIKKPQTLFAIEEIRTRKLDEIVKVIQRTWRSCRGKAFVRKCTYASVGIFYGNKERRSDSVFRPFRGDYIKFKGSKLHKHIQKTYNKVVKINQKNSEQTRVLVVTEKAIYNVGGWFTSIHRRIPLDKIGSISVSNLSDSIFVIHVPTEYDYTIVTDKKTETITIISELCKEFSEKPLLVEFKNEITAKIDQKGTKRTMTFVKDESVKDYKIKKAGSGLTVSVPTGLAKDAGRKRSAPAAKSNKMTQINRNPNNAKTAAAKFVARAVHDYVAKSARELSFKTGDVINVIAKDNTGMWQGEFKGKRGVFPATHVQIV
ncbi:hypothetical protein PROFUN_05333 [Planoprotostelium fungivorum]|uniref:Uncharacterized protein n=1 Tax=Planoprotostelium fungivorum TaxID=1890364 RepID=A0A2P6NR32_9EUKA|nr:hypothetical protein PROFUN_05333 [Planoprotostelium fungivorum]